MRVVLIEDHPKVRDLVLGMISAGGDFKLVQVLETEAEANLWFSENEGMWDLAVVDLVLEQGTGLAVLARAARRRSDGARVVVYSDFTGDAMRNLCLELGADAAFQKTSETRAFADYCKALMVR